VRRAPAPTRTETEIEDAENFEDGDSLRTEDTPDRMLLSKQVAEAVNRAIERLPEDLRTAIVLRELEGLSYDEIAVSMNCPIAPFARASSAREKRCRGIAADPGNVQGPALVSSR